MKYAKWLLVLALLGGVSFGAWHVTQATVSTTPPRNDYVGTGSVDAYDYTFRIFANSDLRVTTEDAAGVLTTLALTTDYTVTGANNPSGGTVTLVAGNLASGTTLTIRSDRTPQQATNLRNQGSFSASTHETKFDELTRYAQQLRDVVARSLHFPETEVGSDAATELPAASVRAGKFLAFDGSGNAITAAGTSANLTPVSTYIDTLLDDANASTARTTLGAVNIAGDTMTGSLTITKASDPRITINTTHGSNRRAILDFNLNGSSKWLLSNDQSLANVQRFSIFDAEASLERLGIDSAGVVSLGAGQLQFPAVENLSTDPSTLDSYLQQAWTPSIGGTATYTVQSGKYTLIGDLVYIQGQITINSLGTGSTSVISGLPKTSAAAAGNDGAITISSSSSLAVSPVSLSLLVPNNSTSMTVVGRTAAATGASALAVFGNGASITFAGFYHR